MKTTFYLLVICVTLVLGCGHKREAESLYYFPNTDSTFVGVINGMGDTIIPAVHPALNASDIDHFYDGSPMPKSKPRIFYYTKPRLIPEARYDFKKPIKGTVIQFYGLSKGSDIDLPPQIPAGEVYDRKGRFLYYVAGITGNENTKGYRFIVPEPFIEGYRHYLEQGKLGFVDGMGSKITPAIWEFAEPFNFGYAKVYHESLAQIQMPGPADHRATTDSCHHYINAMGKRVEPCSKAKTEKDYYVFNGEYLPYPFVYSPAAQHIVDSLNKIKAIAYTNMVDINHTENGESLSFEITALPKAGFPYYFVQGYWQKLGDMNYTFLVHQGTKEIFHCDSQFFITGEKTPLVQWLVKGLQEVNDRWSEENPGAQLKIDINKELRYWEKMAGEK